jgi:hypothetical protein
VDDLEDGVNSEAAVRIDSLAHAIDLGLRKMVWVDGSKSCLGVYVNRLVIYD